MCTVEALLVNMETQYLTRLTLNLQIVLSYSAVAAFISAS